MTAWFRRSSMDVRRWPSKNARRGIVRLWHHHSNYSHYHLEHLGGRLQHEHRWEYRGDGEHVRGPVDWLES